MKETILLLLLFFCHFLADFTPLSTKWMLDAKRYGKPFTPIFVHALIHALLMGVVLFFFLGTVADALGILWQLILLQLCTHFLIDVWKGRMSAWFPQFEDASKRPYWILMGFDQFLHATVIVLMVHFANLN